MPSPKTSTHDALSEALYNTSEMTLTIPIRDRARANQAVADLFTEDYTIHFAGRDHPTQVHKVEVIAFSEGYVDWEAYVVTLVPKITAND